MCAIAGLVHPGGEPIRFDSLVKMTRIQAHRGPDGEGYVLLDMANRRQPFTVSGSPDLNTLRHPSYAVGLGNRRLAIIDPSPLGHQPMTTGDERCWITYNGEIYNHGTLREELKDKGYQFLSSSDTEVVLAAYCEWGISCVTRFNGMFAFALWDTSCRRLFCARDRFGIKPFVYAWDGHTFAFASEIKGLLPATGPCRPNQQVIFQYLEGAYLDCSEETFFNGILHLPPASSLLLENGKVTLSPYWTLKPTEANGRQTAEDAVQEFLDLFSDAVRLRLPCEVPFGFSLSGGLDSSSILCVAHTLLTEGHPSSPRRNAPPTLNTFSSCFEDGASDERRFIAPVLAQANAFPQYVFPDPLELPVTAGDLVWQMDEPFGSTSIYAHWNVMRLAARHGIKVMLNGQGADEYLAGYQGFYGAWFADLLTRSQWTTFLTELLAYHRVHGRLSKYAVANVARGLLPWALTRAIRSRVSHSDRWMAKSFRDRWGPLLIKGFHAPPYFQAMQHELLTGNGLRALLRIDDRNAMAFGIETRLPFLDHRLVEFVYQLPDRCKISGGWTKRILRESMAGILPENVRWRVDKQGFPTPEASWFRTSLRSWIRGILADPRTRERGYLEVDAALSAFDAHVAGKNPLSHTIWRWVNLELWCRCFLDGDPEAREQRPTPHEMNLSR